MPIEELHKKKLKKNVAILALILGFCALVFTVSIVKMKSNTPQDGAPIEKVVPEYP